MSVGDSSITQDGIGVHKIMGVKEMTLLLILGGR